MYRTVAEIEAETQRIADELPDLFTRERLAERSVGGREIHALRLRAGSADGRRPALLFIGGTHARELVNPDALVELPVDLAESYLNGTEVRYDGKAWSADHVRSILEATDIWFLPCMNPDGRDYVMTDDRWWRKNRSDNRGGCVGVDLNRNYDVVWGVIPTAGYTSCDPCDDTYVGPSAFSEPETRNVRGLLDRVPIDCLVDVHSYSEMVLYQWGHASVQTTDPSQNFTTLATGTCAPIPDSGYREYLGPADLALMEGLADSAVDAIRAARGSRYTAGPSGDALYTTSGATDDYAYARHIATPDDAHKTLGFTFETGVSFQPTDPEPVKLETKAGLFAMVENCASASSGGQSVIVTVDFDGRDDENLAADELFDPAPTWFRVTPPARPDPLVYRWGGELRAEYDFDARGSIGGGVTLDCECRLYEGTSTSTGDLDGRGQTTLEVTAGQWATDTLLVTNTEEGDPDDFGRLRLAVQNNPVGHLGLFSMWNPGRSDNHLTSNPRHTRPADHRPDGYAMYRREGLVADPGLPQPLGTIPLVSWWSSGRLDNRATADPRWGGWVGRTREGYRLYRIEGFIFPPDRPQPAGTVSLTSWWHPGRRDHFTSTRDKWQRPVGTVQDGYRAIRMEGFVRSP